MANERRLIDFDKLVDNFKATALVDCFPGWDDMPPAAKEAVIRFTREYRKIVLNQPIVDAVEVVRCGECVNWDKDKLYCHHPAGMSYSGKTGAKKGFCCFGERRGRK